MSKPSPTADAQAQRQQEPLGDRGHGDRTWTPQPGEQGISNRVGDEEPATHADAERFGRDRGEVVAMTGEDPADDADDEDDEEEDDEDEDDEFDEDEEEGEDDEEDEETDEP